MTSPDIDRLSTSTQEIPNDPTPPPRYSTIISDPFLAPPRYSTLVGPRSRSNTSSSERRRRPSSRHQRHRSPSIYPDTLDQYSTLNPHAPDSALASNSAYPSFLNRIPAPRARSHDSSQPAQDSNSVKPAQHHFHLASEGKTHRYLTVRNNDKKELYDVRINRSAPFSRHASIAITSALPSALISSPCRASIRVSPRVIAFTIHDQLVVVTSGKSSSSSVSHGFDFMSSGVGLLRWANEGETGQSDLLLRTVAGTKVARLSSWEKGTKEEGIIRLLCGAIEQPLMEEIAISGLLVLSEEKQRGRNKVASEEGRRMTVSADWLPSDYGMADWGDDRGGRSRFLSAVDTANSAGNAATAIFNLLQ